MIVTLAGHVDHGKTSLVQALTGENTDRLAEEQRRGLTIDLGFAYLNEDGHSLGFVDVPGHHRFIHNMVAGVAGNQYALLVIAADDGPMPQSREHLQILQLIGVTSGVVALTKCDQVDDARRTAAEQEVRELMAASFLEDASIIQTSTVTNEGIDALLAHLIAAGAEHPVQAARRQFRLAVDRAFNVRGAGLVVTGTVHSGVVSLEQELYVLPGNHQARVREIHAQNQSSDTATVGDRCAINLSGVSLQEVQRGSWLSAAPDAGSLQLAITLEVLNDFPRRVRHWTPAHVYHATSHTTGRIALVDRAAMAPGESGLAELILEEPLFAKHGDRLILRDQSLDLTLGGASVAHNREVQGRRSEPSRLARLEAYTSADAADALAGLLDLGPVDVQEFHQSWGLPDDAVAALLSDSEAMIRDGTALKPELWDSWAKGLTEEITTRHKADNALQGLQANEVGERIPSAFRQEVLNELVSNGALVNRSGRFAPPRHVVSLTPEEASLWSRIEPHLKQRQPPSVGDLAKRLRDAPPALRKRMHPLATKGLLVAVSDTRYYLPDELGDLVAIVDELAARAPFTVRDFRDAAEIGRNSAIEVLEYLDSKGYTRRNANTRTVVGDRARVLPQ